MKVMFISMLLIAINYSLLAKPVIRHIPPEDKTDLRNNYYIQLLDLVIKKTEKKFGKIKLQEAVQQMNQSRAIQFMIKNKYIDVVWTMTSVERERKMLPIRIPLYKGLLGCRALLITRSNKNKFKDIDNLNQFKKFIAGQGHDWPDTLILRSNSLKVEPGTLYKSLFTMLLNNRFDYFPRSVIEIWDEYQIYRRNDIVIDKYILLLYPSPGYFFVSLQNHKLAKRIETGLRIAIEDGSFDKVFNVFAKKKKVFQILKNKKIFILKNPYMPTTIPLKDKKLWYFSYE